MSDTDATWLLEFAATAQQTDRFVGSTEHVPLLAAGLMGEAGSILAELKKEKREREAYPVHRHRMLEEIGDFLWYYVRIVSVVDSALLADLRVSTAHSNREVATRLKLVLQFGASVGDALRALTGVQAPSAESRPSLERVWIHLIAVANDVGVSLPDAATSNTLKIASRWPTERNYSGLFDDDFPEEEQLPRHLEIEFRERSLGAQKAVLLRCNGINFGDRLTDNIEDPDGYRYHDVFHFAHAVHLGWSPVVRALLRCKRKSSSKKDEGQDGARSAVLEEAVAAIVFARAKQLNFFEGVDHVDYDLLKTVREFVQGFEVETVALWQWEAAILDGYAVFRKLRSNGGGRVIMDLKRRELAYTAPA